MPPVWLHRLNSAQLAIFGGHVVFPPTCARENPDFDLWLRRTGLKLRKTLTCIPTYILVFALPYTYRLRYAKISENSQAIPSYQSVKHDNRRKVRLLPNILFFTIVMHVFKVKRWALTLSLWSLMVSRNTHNFAFSRCVCTATPGLPPSTSSQRGQIESDPLREGQAPGYVSFHVLFGAGWNRLAHCPELSKIRRLLVKVGYDRTNQAAVFYLLKGFFAS